MKINNKKLENAIVEVTVAFDKEEWKESQKKALNKLSRKVKIDGFRQGKAPIAVVKARIGKGKILEEATDMILQANFAKALEEAKVEPIAQPALSVDKIDEEELQVKILVPVEPEVELGEYKGLSVEKKTYEVTEEEVAKKLKEMQEKNARVESKEEGTVENGNIAVIDFKGFVDGEAFQGGEGHDYSLEIGSKTFIDTFEEQLVGAKVNDTVEVNVTFPENYGKEELNGKPAKFEVTIKEIKVKELPELDDEFAKETSEFDTIAELKADITTKLEAANAERADREFEEAVINTVAENAKVEIPAVMVEKEVDKMVQNLQQRLQYQGLNLEQYFQFTGTDEEKMREYMRENAATKVKVDLVLEAVEKAENIDATEEEIKEKAVEVAKMYSASEDDKMVELLMQSQQAALRSDVITNKAVKFLLENNK